MVGGGSNSVTIMIVFEKRKKRASSKNLNSLSMLWSAATDNLNSFKSHDANTAIRIRTIM